MLLLFIWLTLLLAMVLGHVTNILPIVASHILGEGVDLTTLLALRVDVSPSELRGQTIDDAQSTCPSIHPSIHTSIHPSYIQAHKHNPYH